jgi:ATP-dependent DNA helicase RecG
MDFVAKHLPDKFYLQGDQRVSLRSFIFREVVANLIVHREYTNAHPCTFVITPKRVETKNANNPHGEGLIDPKNFIPFAKNPSIEKFFVQLGRVEELGSGVLNVNRFIKEYSGQSSPEFIEGPVFMMHIPIPKRAEGINDDLEGIKPEFGGLNDDFGGINGGINSLWKLIKTDPGQRSPHYAKKLTLTVKKIEHWLQELKQNGRIRYEGSKKSGGYYVVE